MWKSGPSATDVAKGALAGLVGGVAGSLTMELFQAALKKASGQEGPGEGEPATVKAAQKVYQGVLDRSLAESEKAASGEMVHYAFGASAGVVYGMAAQALPKSSAGRGLLFGAVLWLVADEVGVPASGLSKRPDKTPVSDHASALAAHLVYGATADAVRRAVLSLTR